MTTLLAALAAAAGMVLLLWRSRSSYTSLPELPDPEAGAGVSDVTVVIPARNEAGRIGRAVHGFAGVRVVVVDDGSSDGTAEEARTAGAEVIAAPPPPDGWLGKPHACRIGADHAETDWLLFVDADTHFDPRFLPAALDYARRESLGLLTVFIRQERHSWAERLLLPYAFALYFCGVSARAVNSPDSAEALANGQCLLFRRAAYESFGGHAAVAGSVIEDVALARVAKERGLRLRVGRAEHLGSVRMYDSLGAIWRGFQKNSFRFLKANPASGAQVIAASILLTSWLPLAVLLAADGHWLAAVALSLLPVMLLAPWYGGLRPALAAPVAIYLFQLIALDGMFTVLLGRKASWKGRKV